jgi:membrane-anchored protein YejM (alkaline phosphatase superfamily)
VKWYATFVLLRIVAAIFCVATAAYAVTAYSPFAFAVFIRPRVFAPVNQFVAWHHVLNAVVYVLTVVTLIPDVRERRTRRLALAYIVIFGLVGEWLLVTPYLPKLWNDTNCLVVAIVAFTPLLGLAIIDHVAAKPVALLSVGARPTDERRLLVACFVTAEYLCVLALIRANVLDLGVATVSGRTLAAVWSLALHASAFMAVYAALAAIAAVAALTGRPALWEYALTVPLAGAGVAALLLTVILPTISFSERGGRLVAAVAGVALAGMWSGLGLRRPRRPDADALTPVDVLIAPVAPLGSPAAIVTLIALPIGAAVMLGALEKFDWNFLGQKLTVLVWGTVAFAVCLSLCRSAADHRRSLVRQAGPPLATLAALVMVTNVSARLHRWTDDPWLRDEAALDRYAAIDPSFRLVYEALVEHPSADATLFRFLHANTHVPSSVALHPPDVTLLASRPHTERPPHIFLFVVDSLRRDYVSPYNAAVTFTPGIDAFARESVVFRNAFTHYGGTNLAVPSIWSGALQMHGGTMTSFRAINAIEKLLEADGYRRFIGMDSVMAPLLTRGPSLVELDRGLETMHFDLCRTLTDLEGKLDVQPPDGPPVFAYSLPQTLHISLVFNSKVPSGESYPGFFGPYASRLHRIDGCFGEFITFLKQRQLYDDSVVILTSDHGDSLGEGGRWGHGVPLFPEVVQIPLIMHIPTRLRARVTGDLGAIAFSTDIAPTLYELAGHESARPASVFGSPLLSLSSERLDRDRRRVSDVIVATYAPTYAVVGHNGRLLYILDLVNGREYEFDLSRQFLGERLQVTDAARRFYRDVIRRRIAEVDAFYGYALESLTLH